MNKINQEDNKSIESDNVCSEEEFENENSSKLKLQKKIDRIKLFILNKSKRKSNTKKVNYLYQKYLTFEEEQINKQFDEANIDFSFENDKMILEREELQLKKFDEKLTKLKMRRVKNSDYQYVQIINKNEFDLIKDYTDKYPLLQTRKFIMKIYWYILKFCYHIVKHPIFEFVSMVIIIINSIILMMDSTTTNNEEQSISDRTEFAFMILYTIEMGLKTLGYGFWRCKQSILKDPWNLFDFIIVLMSWVNYLLQDVDVNFSPLRSLKVLRPLKTFSKIKKLKKLIMTIFKSIPFIIDILFILFFVYIIFAIGGLVLFNGVMKKRCFDPIAQIIIQPEKICSDDSVCSNGAICFKNFLNPNYGITNFDNFGSAFLMVFQISTLEGWFPILIQIKNAFSGIFELLIIMYFVMIIFLGNFIILNLMLAVITFKFNETQLDQESKIIFHSNHCICEEGIDYSKVKQCGYFSNLSNLQRQQDYDNFDYFVKENDIHNFLQKEKNEIIYDDEVEESIQQEEENFEIENIQQIESEQSLKLKSQQLDVFSKNPSIFSKKGHKKSIGNMIKSYNKLIQDMQISQKSEQKFNPMQFKLCEEDIQLNLDVKIQDSKYIMQPKKENQEQNLKSVSDENLKEDLMKNIIENQDYAEDLDLSYLQNNHSNNSENQLKNLSKNHSQNNSQYSNLSRLNSLHQNTFKRKKYSKILNSKEQKIMKQLKKKNSKNLKLGYNACLQTKQNELFDSTHDVLPSLLKLKKDYDVQQEKQKREHQNIEMYYDFNQIIYDFYQMKQKFPFNKKIQNKLKQIDDENIESNNQKQYQKFDDNLIPQHLELPLIYYPIYVPNHQIQLDYKEQNFKQEKIQQQKSLKQQIDLQKIKKIKQISKNFVNVQEFFKEEFEDNEEDQWDLLAEKKAIENFHQNCIQQNLESSKISTKNWSGYDVLNVNNFPLEKLVSTIGSLNQKNIHHWIPGFQGKIQVLRNMVKNFITLKQIETILLILVFLNTLILSLDGLLDSSYDSLITTSNDMFTIVFLIEMILKIFGFGIKGYCKEKINLFDGTIVMISIFEQFMQGQQNLSNAIKTVKVFRAIRVLRVTRLLRTLKFMKIITEVIMSSLEQFAYIALLLLLFLIIFSLIGMQVFGGHFNFPLIEYPRQRFDNFFDSFLSVFQIMTLENWNDILYLALSSNQNIAISLLYLFFSIFFGNFIILNLFLAILLEGFQNVSIKQDFVEITNEEEEINKLKQEIKQDLIYKEQKRLKKFQYLQNIEQYENYKKNPIDKRNAIFQHDTDTQSTYNNLSIKSENLNNSIESSTSSEDENQNSTSRSIFQSKIIDGSQIYNEQNSGYNKILCLNSLFCFSKESRFRQFIGKVTLHKYFDQVILFLIIISSITLVIDTYNTNNEWTGGGVIFLYYLDQIITYSFIMEFIMKIITYGFFICPESYLRDPWSCLDFFIVSTSIIDLCFTNVNYQFIKVLRIFRVLRPLRFLTHYENLRIVLEALIESIKVILMVWLMFGILGINLLNGKMGYCYFEDRTKNYYNINFEQCLLQNGQWKIWGWNFDNIFNALTTLFVLSSTEGWPTIMQTAMDSNDAEYGPSFNGNYYICSLFLMNLFVGFIFYQFTQEQEKEKQKKYKLITKKQMKWILMQKLIIEAQPNTLQVSLPKNKFQLNFYKIVMSKVFETLIMICIILNIITMAMIYDEMSDEYSNWLDLFNTIFSFIFLFEALFKILALGIKRYFNSGWNKFDFSIVVTSMLDFVLTQCFNIQTLTIYPQLARVLRVLRITRLFKLMKSKTFQNFNKIIRTLIFSFPALFNVLLLLLLIYFIFAILGVFLFRDVDSNFANFGIAILNLFRFSTGEDWHVTMYELSDKKPYIAKSFFIIFIFFSSFIMLNMFVLIVLEQFENFYFNTDNPINSFEEITDHFRQIWNLYCDETGKKIKQGDIYMFFISLETPLGFYITSSDEDKFNVYDKKFSSQFFIKKLKYNPNFVRRKIAKMNLLIDNQGYVHFGQVLHAAMKNAYGIKQKHTDYQTYQTIKKLETKTLSEILKKNKVKSNQYNKTKKVVNPFTNLLFIQLIYQSWYNQAKKKVLFKDKGNLQMKSDESLSEFEEKVLNSIEIPDFNEMEEFKIFPKNNQIIQNIYSIKFISSIFLIFSSISFIFLQQKQHNKLSCFPFQNSSPNYFIDFFKVLFSLFFIIFNTYNLLFSQNNSQFKI